MARALLVLGVLVPVIGLSTWIVAQGQIRELRLENMTVGHAFRVGRQAGAP